MNESLAASYRHCRRATRGASSNFGFTFLLLPAEKRTAMCALYAFLRRTDDLADDEAPRAEKRQRLTRWREQLTAALAGRYEHELLPALHDTVTRYAIPHEHLFATIEGAMLDLEKHRYETFAELTRYCDQVASSVGLACMHVWGFRPENALDSASACGRAFQLTNILRDLREDAARGRIYLPLEDLRRHDYTAEDLLAGRVDGRLTALVQFQVRRAAELYARGSTLWESLSPDGRRVFAAMFGTYRELLQQIARHPERVWESPASVGRCRKLSIAAAALLGRRPSHGGSPAELATSRTTTSLPAGPHAPAKSEATSGTTHSTAGGSSR